MKITRELAQKVLAVVDKGLSEGLGDPIPGKMCVEAAVCYALGEDHDDKPSCVANAVRSVKIYLNDSDWPSKKARAQGLRRLAIAQLGSKGKINEPKFVEKVKEKRVKRFLPIAINTFLSKTKFKKLIPALIELYPLVDSADEFNKILDCMGIDDKYDRSCFFDYLESDSEDYAISAIIELANSRLKSKLHQWLKDYAEDIVQVLIEMKCPGAKFLSLTQ